MRQIRNAQTMCNLEPLFDDLMEQVVQKEGFASKSIYLRSLVINDLLVRNLIGQKELLEVLK